MQKHTMTDHPFEPTTEDMAQFQQSERAKGWLALFGVGLAALVMFSSFISLA